MLAPTRFAAAALVSLAATAATATTTIPVPTQFTYQGNLVLNGEPVDGTADIIVRLYDGNVLIAGDTSNTNVQVNDGLFSIDVLLASQFFDGTDYTVEIAARSPAGSGSYTTLSPRQPLRTTPYAFHSNTADTLLTPSTIQGVTTETPMVEIRNTNAVNSLDDAPALRVVRDQISGEFLNIVDRTLEVDTATTPIGLLATGGLFPIVAISGANTGRGAAFLARMESDTDTFSYGMQIADLRPNRGDTFLNGPEFAGDFGGDVIARGDVFRPYAAFSQDLLHPIAYGFINSNGSPGRGTPNFNSTFNAALTRYEIEIDNENYAFSSYVTIVTSIETNQVANIGSVSGRLIVELEDGATGANETGRFMFVTYRPSGSAAILGRNRPALQPLDPRIPLDNERFIDAPLDAPRPPLERASQSAPDASAMD